MSGYSQAETRTDEENMSKKLALCGGDPIRVKSYPEHTTMIDEAEEKQVLEVLRKGHLSGFSATPGARFLGGEKVRELEEKFAEYFQVKHAISFNSATSALHGIISAAKIGPGDEVIVSPFTMSATATAILMQNAVPVFADIEDETYGLDPESVKKVISPRTKAILTVNLFGHPSRLKELEIIAKDHKILLLEDNAQGPGAMVEGKRCGTIGVMGIQSLNYHKFIQTGEGGVALTDDDAYAKHLRLMRNHGEVVIGKTPDYSDDELVNMIGWNYRLTEIQAAIGIPQLEKLDYLNDIRISLAEQLTSALADFSFLVPPMVREKNRHIYYVYPMRFLKEKIGISRSVFVQAMKAEGIAIAQGYVRPIYFEPIFQKKIGYGTVGCPFKCPHYNGQVSYDKGLCPNNERLHFEEILTTDICKYPNTEKEVDEFAQAVEKIVSNIDELKDIQ